MADYVSSKGVFSKGKLLMSEDYTPTIDDHETSLYEKCADCHLFVEPNESAFDSDGNRITAPEIAGYVHLHRGDDADEALDESHEARPSGMKATLSTWRVYGPEAMRERFTREVARG